MKDCTQQKASLFRNIFPKALCLAEDIAACLALKLHIDLQNKVQNVQVSDTTEAE